MADGSPLFRVVRSEKVRETLRQWGERAKALGLVAEYVAALRTIEEQLSRDPLVWGDPVKHLHSLNLLLCRKIHWKIQVDYAVNQEAHVVFVRRYRLVLDNPLLPHPEDNA